MSRYANLGLLLLRVGKVRELYRDGTNLLMIATDNVSAFDRVLDVSIPSKGVVVTQMSLWWFDQLKDLVDNHVISTEVPEEVAGRAIIVEELDMIPVECVARGYLTGSAWAEYSSSGGTVCGISLPPGLRKGERLPEPIFTPAQKAAAGEHDENLSFGQLKVRYGEELAEQLRQLTLVLYDRASKIARDRGIIIADTKFEFGRRSDGKLVLADEALTPDSSRFWDAASWNPDTAPHSLDKQYLRDWLAAYTEKEGKPSPGQSLTVPEEVIDETRSRYITAYERLTRKQFRYATQANRVMVNVMPKPEILDPQGKAVTSALARLGFEGVTVRQGKRFELAFDGDVTDELLEKIRDAAEKLLSNPVIESYEIAHGD